MTAETNQGSGLPAKGNLPELSEFRERFGTIQLQRGTKVDRYILERMIGAGGMGAVYLARHARLKSRLYAIKFIKPGLVDAGVRQRFEAEIDALEKIQHPNFVFAHDAGEFEGVTYLVMEYVEGASLSQLVADSRTLPVANAAEIVRQTALGLQHAFEQGLVHRDIKPSNLVLSKDGTVKILDLGLARFCDPAENLGLTGSLQILGTPDYMSPEQCRNSTNVDIRSDIYSLGCTLYRLVTGKAPFGDGEHSSIANKITAHLSEDPTPIQSQSKQSLPKGLIAVLEKMICKDPDQRFQTPEELVKAIEPFAEKSNMQSIVAEPSIESPTHTITKNLNAPSVETDAIKLPTPVSSPARLNWKVPAIVAAVLSVAAWGWYSLGDVPKEVTSSNPTTPATVQPAGETEPRSDFNKNEIESSPSDPESQPILSPPEPNEQPRDNNLVVDPKPTQEAGDPTEANDTPVELALTETAKTTPAAQPKPAIKTAPAKKAAPKRTDELLASQVKQIFRSRCSECHGSERKEADLDLLAWKTFVGEEGSVVPNDADASYLFERIATDDEDYRMPELPLEALSQTEVETVRRWIEAGAPEFPADVAPPQEENTDVALKNVFGAEYVLSQIATFLEQQPRANRPYYRFFSSNHLLTSGATAEELKTQHQALAKAINHLSMQPTIVQPAIVDEGLETIFAVDIRKLGWQQRPFKTRDGNPSAIDRFDLVLLEYPYSIAFPDSTNFEKLWDLFMSRGEMVRPIPYVRSDWFVSIATQFPLYEDLLGLPDNLPDLEAMLGVDSDTNMRDYVAQRAGMAVSGVSQNNRVVERHPSRFGSYWKSYDFETSRGRQNMFTDPMHFDFAGGEMVFSLPNGLQGYLITDTRGNRINAAPTNIVTDKFAADKVVRNGLACMRCHDKGMKRFADNIRPAIENLPSGSMINKKDVLRLYPNKTVMDEFLDIDEKKFLNAMEKVLGEPQSKDPLAEVSRNFLDNAIALNRAAAEMGLKENGSLNAVFALPQFTRFGLAGLTQGGVVRRDTWEDYYDRIARGLGIGIPVVPVNGLMREDHLADGRSERLILKTNKRSNTFSPGESVIITIENNTGVDLFIEVIGTSVGGKINEVTNGVISLHNGKSIKLPDEKGYVVQPKLGSEKITVYASPVEFSRGTLLTAKNDTTYVADRFIHNWYQYDPSAEQPMQYVADQLIKKTLKIDTK